MNGSDLLPHEKWTADYFEENFELCRNYLSDNQKWTQIPSLNITGVESFEDNSVVRFCGMIRDVRDPVYYLDRYALKDQATGCVSLKSGRYRDCLPCQDGQEILFNSSENVHNERQVLVCAADSAINDWVSQHKYLRKCVIGEKSNMETDESSSNVAGKRQLEESNAQCESVSKKARTDNEASTSNEDVEMSVEVNASAPTSQAFIVNLYCMRDGDVKLNDVIEVVAFLSKCPLSVTSEDEDPYTAVPRLHVLAINKVRNTFDQLQLAEKEYLVQNANEIRDELWLLLTEMLAGDTLAADYLICHLISTVYLREPSLILGKFSLNVANIPDAATNNNQLEYVQNIYNILSSILAKTQFFNLNVATLNDTTMIPRRDNQKGILETGLLQMSKGTHLIIDETNLEEGRLVDKGVRNVRALGEMIEDQKVNYDFQYYNLEFETDVPVLIFSRGKSILPTDSVLVMDADESCLQDLAGAFVRVRGRLVEPLLSRLRNYLMYIKTLDYSLPQELAKHIQDEYVRMRQEDNKTSSEDLHKLLVLARLFSLSKGSSTLEKPCWDKVCEMEQIRKLRYAAKFSN